MTPRMWLLLLPMPLAAHMMSLSTGEMRIEGQQGHYELRMPLYEIAHMKDPERALLEGIRFSSGGAPAARVQGSCREDAADGAYLCDARYRFSAPVERLEAECRFYQTTVPNHVHLLRVSSDGRKDQAVLDFTFPKAELRFSPPGAVEVAITEMSAGIFRAAGGAAQLLFLATLVLAARRRRELFVMTVMFLLGEIATCLVLPLTGWRPAPRFIEAAAALTIAYLAVEILVLTEAGWRWLVVAVLGVFHGFYFELFIRSSGYSAAYVLTGVAVSEITIIGLFAALFSRIQKAAASWRPVQVSASVLLAIGLVWFALRLRG